MHGLPTLGRLATQKDHMDCLLKIPDLTNFGRLTSHMDRLLKVPDPFLRGRKEKTLLQERRGRVCLSLLYRKAILSVRLATDMNLYMYMCNIHIHMCMFGKWAQA